MKMIHLMLKYKLSNSMKKCDLALTTEKVVLTDMEQADWIDGANVATVPVNKNNYQLKSKNESLPSMKLDCLLDIVNCKLIESHNHPLNSTEILILHGVWKYRTYNQIAIEAGYSPGYFTNVVAPQLYQRLSKFMGQRVTKKKLSAAVGILCYHPSSCTNKTFEGKSGRI